MLYVVKLPMGRCAPCPSTNDVLEGKVVEPGYDEVSRTPRLARNCHTGYPARKFVESLVSLKSGASRELAVALNVGAWGSVRSEVNALTMFVAC